MVDIEDRALQLISLSGQAKSVFLESIKLFRQGDVDKSHKLFKEAKVLLKQAHDIFKDVFDHLSSDNSKLEIVVINAQEHFMNASLLGDIAAVFVDIDT